MPKQSQNGRPEPFFDNFPLEREFHGFAGGLFTQIANQRRLCYVRYAGYPIREDPPAIEDLGGKMLFQTQAGIPDKIYTGKSVLDFPERGVALIEANGSRSVSVEVAASEEEACDQLFEEIWEKFHAPDPIDNDIGITFWAMSTQGPRTIYRTLEVPPWQEIQGNYSQTTLTALDRLVGSDGPQDGLILWYGDAGTGKTYALRALAHAWREWCTIHYVIDPEEFLGHGKSYLLDLLSHDNDKWKLVVLEDGGELLTKDARERVGQALSRLLNMTDGLLGEGMQTMVLITTNEPVDELHEAVQRPGRCWEAIEFKNFTHKEATRWLGEEHNLSEPTLAELYAYRQGNKRSHQPESNGFGFAIPEKVA